MVTSGDARALVYVGARLSAAHLERAEGLLSEVSTAAVTASRLDRAGRLAPPAMRTLDAIHLATTLELRAELDAFVAYDARLAQAAASHGLHTVAPG